MAADSKSDRGDDTAALQPFSLAGSNPARPASLPQADTREEVMRRNLKQARMSMHWTQQQMAEYLHVSLRLYKYIESGQVMGSIPLWDALEDLLGIHQRVLRENYDGKADNLS